MIAVGGVDEPFGDLVSIWNDCSPGRERRLQSLCTSLGLRVTDIGNIRYQLLHCNGLSHLQRYRAPSAVMLVLQRDRRLIPRLPSIRRLGIPVQAVNRVSEERECAGVRLRLAWVKDQPQTSGLGRVSR